MKPKSNRQHTTGLSQCLILLSSLLFVTYAAIRSKVHARRRLKILAWLICSILSTSAVAQSPLQKQVENSSTDRVSTKTSEKKSSPSSDGKTQQVVNQGIAVGLSVTSLTR